MDEIRDIINMVESHLNEKGGLVSPLSYEVAVDPVKEIADIILGLNKLIAVIDSDTVDSTAMQRTISCLHEVNQTLKDALDSIEQEITEDAVTEPMAPSVKNGVQNYANPNGDSYPERKGYTG